MSILFSESPLVVNPRLAKLIGLNEAIILQQLHYWIQKSTNEHNGKFWVYNSYEKWQEQFEFWGLNTIKRTLANLKKMGLIKIQQLSADKRDKTNYYALDYQAIDLLECSNVVEKPKNKGETDHKPDMGQCIDPKWTDASTQNGTMHRPKLTSCYKNNNFNTETTTETTTENKKNIQKIKPKSKAITKPSEDATRLATYLLRHILKLNPKFKQPPNIELWAKDIDLMLRLDKRTVAEVKDCISWIYSPDGEFWRKVVLSGKKLREKFDQMNIQAISKAPTRQELELSEIAQSFANVLRKKGVADDEILRQLRAEGLVA